MTATTTALADRRRARRSAPVAVETPGLEVLDSKLQSPPLREGLVSRTALVNRLRTVRSAPLVLLVAPAGYGKTTVLAQWAARDERPFAWMTIDERDNDPLVLLRHLARALEPVAPVDASVIQALEDPEEPLWERALPRLARAFAAAPEPIVLVIDEPSACAAANRPTSSRCCSTRCLPGRCSRWAVVPSRPFPSRAYAPRGVSRSSAPTTSR